MEGMADGSASRRGPGCGVQVVREAPVENRTHRELSTCSNRPHCFLGIEAGEENFPKIEGWFLLCFVFAVLS